jgi:ribosomal silencing factor RsfS
MKNVLDVYKQPYSKDHLVVCMNESPKQLIAKTRIAEKLKDRTTLVDYEYARKDVCNIEMQKNNAGNG